MAWIFAHPWRSAVARCVAPKRTEAETPPPVGFHKKDDV